MTLYDDFINISIYTKYWTLKSNQKKQRQRQRFNVSVTVFLCTIVIVFAGQSQCFYVSVR